MECVKPGPSEKLSEIGLALLKFVSSFRGLTYVALGCGSERLVLTHSRYDNFDEYTRRQFLAKAPERNPFGDQEAPLKFTEFDVFTKIKILHQLSVWTLNNPDRVRSQMEETENEQLGWVCFRLGVSATFG